MAELGSGLGSSYPSAYDTDSSKEVNYPTAGFTYARAEVPNDLADAVLKIQGAVGLTPQGVLATLSDRLDISIGSDGGLKPNTVGDSQVNPAQKISRLKIDFGDAKFYFPREDPVQILSLLDQSSISWTEFSTSPWVSATAIGVDLIFSLRDTGATQASLKIRRFGSTEEENILQLRTQVPGKWIDGSGSVRLGSGQKFQYALAATGQSTTSFNILLAGYYD